MKTHIDIDEKLVEYIRERGGYRTKKAAVHAALRRMASRMAAKDLLAMKGMFDGKDGRPTWHYDDDYLRHLQQDAEADAGNEVKVGKQDDDAR